MINIEQVIKYLDKKHGVTFKKIWEDNKKQFIEKFKDKSESELKTDVHFLISNDERVVLFFNDENEQVFDLAKNYSYSELKKLKSQVFSEIFNDQLDENVQVDETEEIDPDSIKLTEIEETEEIDHVAKLKDTKEEID